eukprot:11822916-Alexandrium_andersonii.AAC.1
MGAITTTAPCGCYCAPTCGRHLLPPVSTHLEQAVVLQFPPLVTGNGAVVDEHGAPLPVTS